MIKDSNPDKEKEYGGGHTKTKTPNTENSEKNIEAAPPNNKVCDEKMAPQALKRD